MKQTVMSSYINQLEGNSIPSELLEEYERFFLGQCERLVEDIETLSLLRDNNFTVADLRLQWRDACHMAELLLAAGKDQSEVIEIINLTAEEKHPRLLLEDGFLFFVA
jgi:hypothetical protein